MNSRPIRRILTLFAGVLIAATAGHAQISPTLRDAAVSSDYAWLVAQSASSVKEKLIVVTVDSPNRRQTCRIQSFTPDKLVCSRGIGGSHAYLRQQVAALVLPGDGTLKLKLVLGLNGGIGAAIWGTVVLAAACPACAVGTGVVAFLLFCAGGAILYGDDQPDRLLYLAPGQQLSQKLGFVQR